MKKVLEALCAAGVLGPLDVHFARALGRIGGEARPDVLLAAALASRQVGQGHVCLDLEAILARSPLVDASGRPVGAEALPDWAQWIVQLRESPLVDAREDGGTPLVLEAGRLYLRRYWQYERTLAARLAARARETRDLDVGTFRSGLDRFFPRRAPASAEPDARRVAAFVALRRRLCVIAGGPGTGKTSTVVRIVALAIEQAAAAGRRPPAIALVAPTGKAAARLSETIRTARDDLPCVDAVRAAVGDAATTIHRLLGSRAGSATGFRHDARNPVRADLLVVDEASMVDLALMARLVDALPAEAGLILLGDKDQLSSVEAGAVLGDICNAGAGAAASASFTRELAAATGEDVSRTLGPSNAHGIGDCIVELTHSYRYDATSGIARLARAIRAGDADGACALLRGGDPDATLALPAAQGGLGPAFARAVRTGFAPYLERSDPDERLRAFASFRVLCAHRRGVRGVESVNHAIEHVLAEAGQLRLDGTFYAGRPLLVTRNDYALRIFNGDVGIVAEQAADDGASRLAVFPASGGGYRLVSPARLPACETAYAMSVHKSQGSEFDEVLIVLPDQPSAIVSRELLYTAVSRARRSVTIHADERTLRRAIEAPIRRESGLRRLLWGEHGR